jgi:hypothetical protein
MEKLATIYTALELLSGIPDELNVTPDEIASIVVVLRLLTKLAEIAQSGDQGCRLVDTRVS